MPQERPTQCLICHQKAFGYNYDVSSCNACKMFFRRSCIDKIEVLCRRDGKCFDGDDIAETRPHCRACRFDKCLKMGMTPHRISEDSPPVVPKAIVVQEQFDCSMLKTLADLHKTRMDIYSVININEDPSFKDLVIAGSKLGEYNRPRNIDWPSTIRKLKPWGSLGVMVTAEVCKTLDVYQELLLSDRVLVLKNAAFKSHHFSIAYDSFERKKGRVLAPLDREMFPPQLIENPNCEKVIMELLTSPMQPLIDLKIALPEFLLMNMIIICNPGINGLSPGGQKTLSAHQQRYAKLLFNLCLIKNAKSAPSRYTSLLAINQTLDKQIYITQKLDRVLRTHWDPHYYFPNILYDSCRMENCEWIEKRNL